MIRWYQPAKWQPKKMPHLEATLDRIGKHGACFFRSVGFVLDVPQAKLCVGTFPAATAEELIDNPAYSAEPFLHCWAEVGDAVFAPTTYESCNRQLVPFQRDSYYEGNGAKDVVCMSRAQLLRLSRKYGLGKHLLYLRPLGGNLRFATVILDELGISHALSKEMGLIPGD